MASQKEASANFTYARANAAAKLRSLDARLAAAAAYPGGPADGEIWGRTLSENTPAGPTAASSVHKPATTLYGATNTTAVHQSQPASPQRERLAPQPQHRSPYTALPPQSHSSAPYPHSPGPQPQSPGPYPHSPGQHQIWPQHSAPFFNAPPMSPYMFAPPPMPYMPYMPMQMPYMPYMHAPGSYGPPPPHMPPFQSYPPPWGMAHPYPSGYYGNPNGTASQPGASESYPAKTDGTAPVPVTANVAPEHQLQSLSSRVDVQEIKDQNQPQGAQNPAAVSAPEGTHSSQGGSKVKAAHQVPSFSSLPLPSEERNSNGAATQASPGISVAHILSARLNHESVKLSPHATGTSSPRSHQNSEGGPSATLSSSVSRYAPTADPLGTPLKNMPITPASSGGGASSMLIPGHIPGSGSRFPSLSGIQILHDGSRGGGGALSPSASARGSRGGAEVTSIKVRPSESSRGGGEGSPVSSMSGSRGGALADAIRALPSDGFRVGGFASPSPSSGGSRGGADPLAVQGATIQTKAAQGSPSTTAAIKVDTVSESGVSTMGKSSAEDTANILGKDHSLGNENKAASPASSVKLKNPNEDISKPASPLLSPASSPSAVAGSLQTRLGSNSRLSRLSREELSSPG